MKKLLFFITVLATLFNTAFAFSEKSNWNEIRNRKGITIVQPKFAEAFGPDGLFNACVTEDEIRSINPVSVCLDKKDLQKGLNMELGTYIVPVCVKSAIQDVVVNKNHDLVECKKHAPETEFSSNECIEWEQKSARYPNSYSIEIIRTDKLEAGNHLFSKTLELAACE